MRAAALGSVVFTACWCIFGECFEWVLGGGGIDDRVLAGLWGGAAHCVDFVFHCRGGLGGGEVDEDLSVEVIYVSGWKLV